ncbi:MAG: endolytic transglycosylase MltG [Clostridia bacterium]|nr:endolytic transglycosylase MltG [Clostridia bacterium]
MSDLRERIEKKRQVKRKKALFRLSVFAVIVLLTIICSVVSYKYVIKNTGDSEKETTITIEHGKEIEVKIPLGAGPASIAEILKKEGIISHPRIFKLISKINGYDSTYKSGTHVLSKDLSYTEIMRVLSSKPTDNTSVKATIPEGLTLDEIINKLNKDAEKQKKPKLVDKDRFKNLVENGKFDYKFIKDIPQGREFRLQGYLFPETYFFDSDGKEEEVINKMLGQFDKIFSEEYLKRAKELNMTVDQIITLASLIERESSVKDERPKIAAVFYNRLKSKDASLRRLQSCASVQYILLKTTGKTKTRLFNEDTKIDDPYNTYLHEGLPPGPICSPGEDAINAALYPEENDYLYFVAKEDGTGGHYFSRTFKEHLSAQAKAQKNIKD